jgi:hypothetical protein
LLKDNKTTPGLRVLSITRKSRLTVSTQRYGRLPSIDPAHVMLPWGRRPQTHDLARPIWAEAYLLLIGLGQPEAAPPNMQRDKPILIGSLGTAAAFSTIEALVSVLICGLVFVSLYSGLSTGFAFIQLARENLRGTQIMQQKMETVRLYAWDQVNTPGFIPTNFVEAFYPVGTQTTSGLTYTGMVTVADAGLTEAYAADLKQVTVNLSWVSGHVLRQRQMTTFVAKNGLQQYVY